MKLWQSDDLTPGAVLALQCLIGHVHQDGPLSAPIAAGLLRDSGLLGGTMPANEAISIGIRADIIENSAGLISLSSYSLENIAEFCDPHEPRIDSIRAILFRILSIGVPPWLAFFADDEIVFRAAIPERWIELLDEAELLIFTSNGVKEWWSGLLAGFHRFEEDRAKQVGDVGELLTFNFERERINDDGHNAGSVIWVSLQHQDPNTTPYPSSAFVSP
jgi:hypothetical protein